MRCACRPDAWFSMRILKTMDIMEVPLLKSFLHQLLLDALCDALVDPGKLEINMESTGPTKIPSKVQPKALGKPF